MESKDVPLKFIQDQSLVTFAMKLKQLELVPILAGESKQKQHTLWIQNKVAMARVSSKTLVPHEDVMKKSNALIAENAKKHAVS